MKKLLVATAVAAAALAWANDDTRAPSEHAQDTTATWTSPDATALEMEQAGIGGSGTAGQANQPGVAQPGPKTEADKSMKHEGMSHDGMKTAEAKPTEGKSGGKMMELGVTVPSDLNVFVNKLAHHNDLEIKMAELAKNRATSKATKAHAEKMLKDHTALKQKVETWMQKEKIAVAEPKALDDRDQKMMDAHHATMAKLEVMEGQAFDQAYLTAMLDGHNDTIAKAMVATEQFRDTELAKMLKKELPTLMEHRNLTHALLGKEKPNLALMKK